MEAELCGNVVIVRCPEERANVRNGVKYCVYSTCVIAT